MFKKLFVATILAIASVSVNAQSWKMITDSTNGLRLVVDTDSIVIDKYMLGNAERYRIHGTMQYLGGNPLPPFKAIIDTNDCLVRGGGPLVNLYENGEQSNYVWDTNGTKMFDAQGQFLCGWLQGVIEVERRKNEQQRPQPSTQRSKGSSA